MPRLAQPCSRQAARRTRDCPHAAPVLVLLPHTLAHMALTRACMCTHAGVIWLGDSVIEGVPETLDMLRKMVCSARGAGAVPCWPAPWRQLACGAAMGAAVVGGRLGAAVTGVDAAVVGARGASR